MVNAARKLMRLVVGNAEFRRVVGQSGGIAPLIRLLRTAGSAGDKAIAAGTLCCLAGNDGDNTKAIAKAGAIAPLIDLLRTEVPVTAKANAVGLLCCLAADNAENKKAIAEAGGIDPLIELLGSAGTQAAGALYLLTLSDDLRQRIEELGYTREQLKSLMSS
eukprot:1184157-Prorocentrum_minimum.AAC.2